MHVLLALFVAVFLCLTFFNFGAEAKATSKISTKPKTSTKQKQKPKPKPNKTKSSIDLTKTYESLLSSTEELRRAKEYKAKVWQEMAEYREQTNIQVLKNLRNVALSFSGPARFRKRVEDKLKVCPFQDTENLSSRSDALLNVCVLEDIGGWTHVDLRLSQNCTLLEKPDTATTAVTYLLEDASTDAEANETVDRVLDAFVIDYLKANQTNKVSN